MQSPRECRSKSESAAVKVTANASRMIVKVPCMDLARVDTEQIHGHRGTAAYCTIPLPPSPRGYLQPVGLRLRWCLGRRASVRASVGHASGGRSPMPATPIRSVAEGDVETVGCLILQAQSARRCPPSRWQPQPGFCCGDCHRRNRPAKSAMLAQPIRRQHCVSGCLRADCNQNCTLTLVFTPVSETKHTMLHILTPHRDWWPLRLTQIVAAMLSRTHPQEAPPMVCAHGGDNAQAPPNTMRAFRAAIDGGVRCLEVRQGQGYSWARCERLALRVRLASVAGSGSGQPWN